MAWTYDDSLATEKDQVRFLIGDTDENEQLASDGEIAWALTNNPVYAAAAIIAESIAAVFARKADFTSGDESVKCSQVAENYAKKAAELRKRSVRSASVSPYMGGKSIAEKEAQSDNSDLVQPYFKKGMFDSTVLSEDDCKC